MFVTFRTTKEGRLSPTIASLRTGDAGKRKGSYGGFVSPQILRNLINPCVWNKTGRPKQIKPLPVLEQTRARSAFGVRTNSKEDKMFAAIRSPLSSAYNVILA